MNPSQQLFLIFYRGKLAAKHTEMGFELTAFRAKCLKQRLAKEKGWALADIEIKPAPQGGINEHSN